MKQIVHRLRRSALVALLTGALGCGGAALHPENEIPVGLLLSYSGYLAANSINSERALTMAFEAVNDAGGVGGRPLRIIARDTRSAASKVGQPARELVAAGVATIIGPDTTDLATALRSFLQDRTILLPSFNTSSDVEYKPPSWFVSGPTIARVACELRAQLAIDGRRKPLVVVNPTGYNSSLSWELTNKYGFPKYVLPTDQTTTLANVRPLTNIDADSYVLAAFPTAASSLVLALTAIGALNDPTRWYLSPTLHTPAFIESIPKGLLKDARGVSPGTVAGAAQFRAAFRERWHDAPLDDAYAFYDAGAVTALALQRALIRENAIPTGTGLSKHIIGVTQAGGMRVQWDQIDRGLELLREGQEVNYAGLSGPLEYDQSGKTPSATTNWWTAGDTGFADVSNDSDCH
jgi:branched-chain amino acid transport system substrate-binding protein